MRWVFLVLVTTFIFALQTSLVVFIPVRDATPDLFVILLVFVCLYADPFHGLLAGSLIGSWKDILSGDRAGLFLLVFAIAGYVVAVAKRQIFIDNPVAEIATTFCVCLLCGVLRVAVLALLRSGEAVTVLWHQALWTSLLTALFAPILFALFRASRFWHVRGR